MEGVLSVVAQNENEINGVNVMNVIILCVIGLIDKRMTISDELLIININVKNFSYHSIV